MKKKLSLCIAILTIFSMLFTGCNLSGSLQGTAVDQNSETSITENGVETTYETFSEAWEYVNTHTDVSLLVTLKEDVDSLENSITVAERTAPIVLDLNSYTINRGLADSQSEDGSVFSLNNAGSLTVKNGTVTGANTSSYGGGFFIDNSNAELNLEGVTVTGNHSFNEGAGLFISSAKNVTLKNCKVESNTTDSYGGGIYMTGNKSTVTLDEVTITGNSAIHGAGMYIFGNKSTTATLKDVSITNNNATGSCGGLYWAEDENGGYMASLVMKDKVIIKDNTADESSTYKNFYKASDNIGLYTLDVENLGEGSDIHIAIEGEGVRKFAYIENGNENSIAGYFTSDDDSYVIDTNNRYIRIRESSYDSNNDYVARINYKGEWTYYKTFARAWVTANAWDDENVTLQLLDDWTANNDGDLDDANGYGANDFGWYKNMLNPRVREDNKDSWLIVDLNNHTINRNLYRVGRSHKWKTPVKNKPRDYGTIFYIDDDINMKIINGTLTGGNTTENGGAIWVNDKNVNLELTKLTITDNRSSGDGSAIWINDCHWVKLDFVYVQDNYTNLNSTAAGAVVFNNGDLYFLNRVLIYDNCGKAPLNENEKYDGDNNLVLNELITNVSFPYNYAGSNIHITSINTGDVSGEDGCRYKRFADYDAISSSEIKAFHVNDYNMKKIKADGIVKNINTVFGITTHEYWAVPYYN